jgi:hypothetical protein
MQAQEIAIPTLRTATPSLKRKFFAVEVQDAHSLEFSGDKHVSANTTYFVSVHDRSVIQALCSPLDLKARGP